MSDSRPIGILDSGFGGLTVVRELMRLMPGEHYIYIGVTARGPYGNKSDEAIKSYALQSAQFLMSKDIKMVVAAHRQKENEPSRHVVFPP